MLSLARKRGTNSGSLSDESVQRVADTAFALSAIVAAIRVHLGVFLVTDVVPFLHQKQQCPQA